MGGYEWVDRKTDKDGWMNGWLDRQMMGWMNA